MQNQTYVGRQAILASLKQEIDWHQQQIAATQRAYQALTVTPTNTRTTTTGNDSGTAADIAFLTMLLQGAPNGLTPSEIRQMTQAAGRAIPSNFYPGNLLNSAKGFRSQGKGTTRRYYLRGGAASRGMRKPVARAGSVRRRSRRATPATMAAGAVA